MAPTPESPARCPNCGAAAPGRYCASCGQRQDRRLASTRRMAAEAMEDQLSLGAALPRTLAALLRPGFLTREYLAGRIVRYIPPLRLYLVTSLAFFFLLSWSTGTEQTPSGVTGEAVVGTTPAPEAAGDRPETGTAGKRGPINVEIDTTRGGWIDTPIRKRLHRQIQRINAMEKGEFERRFLASAQQSAPKAVFLLVPIYALILKLLYLRRRRLYAEHFVFGLHVHAFVFAVFSLLFIAPARLDQLLVIGWIPLYVFLAMLWVYQQSIWKTFAKWSLLFFAYSTALGLVLTVTALIVAFTV